MGGFAKDHHQKHANKDMGYHGRIGSVNTGALKFHGRKCRGMAGLGVDFVLSIAFFRFLNVGKVQRPH